MVAYYDRVKLGVASAPGTGDISLGTEVATYLTFVQARAQDGDFVPYLLQDGTSAEWGFGTYVASTNKFQRTLIAGAVTTSPTVLSTNPLTATVNAILSVTLISEEAKRFFKAPRQTYAKYRIANMVSAGNHAFSAAEIALYDLTHTRIVPASVTASQEYTGQPATAAQDNNPATSWGSSDKTAVTYDLTLTTAAALSAVAIMARQDSNEDQTPQSFDLQGSNDSGTTYTTIAHLSFPHNFVGGETQSAIVVPTEVLKTSSLADISATAPTDGQVLTWDALTKTYVPKAASGGGGGGGSGGDGSVGASNVVAYVVFKGAADDGSNASNPITIVASKNISSVERITDGGGIRWKVKFSAPLPANCMPVLSERYAPYTSSAGETPVVDRDTAAYDSGDVSLVNEIVIKSQYGGMIWLTMYDILATSGVPASAAPSIVQSAAATGATVTLTTAPTPGNLLVAFATHFANASSAASGWLETYHSNGNNTDGNSLFYKVAQVGESTSQTPIQGFGSGCNVVVYELTNTSPLILGQVSKPQFEVDDLTGSTFTGALLGASGALVLGIAARANGGSATVAITGDVPYTLDANAASGSRNVTGFHTVAAKPATALTVTFPDSAECNVLVFVFVNGGSSGTSKPWYWSPPKSSDFTLDVKDDTPAPTLIDDPDVGMELVLSGSQTSGDRSHAKLIPASTNSNWSVTAHLKAQLPQSNYMNGGLAVMHQGGSYITHFGFHREGDNTAQLVVNRFSQSGTGFGDTQVSQTYYGNEAHLRISYDATADVLLFQRSTDGKRWLTITSVAGNAYLGGAVTHIGVGIFINNVSNFGDQVITVDRWELTGFGSFYFHAG